mmetsp:Transcript_17839/g.58349  ORF Transcript_17839/g.58349 Transcript_17839/m.58349 type:complete len:284 (+) Transcript_17839:1276-2127(+)
MRVGHRLAAHELLEERPRLHPERHRLVHVEAPAQRRLLHRETEAVDAVPQAPRAHRVPTILEERPRRELIARPRALVGVRRHRAPVRVHLQIPVVLKPVGVDVVDVDAPFDGALGHALPNRGLLARAGRPAQLVNDERHRERRLRQPHRGDDKVGDALRAVNDERGVVQESLDVLLLAGVDHAADEARDAKDVVAVHVRDEDARDAPVAERRLHQLHLRPFAAVKEPRLALEPQSDGGDVAPNRRRPARRAQKAQLHPGETHRVRLVRKVAVVRPSLDFVLEA